MSASDRDPLPENPGKNMIIVYDQPDFKGLKKEFTDSITDLGRISFNNCISSLIVFGQPWVAYELSGFGGWAQEFEEGQYPNIEKQNQISSMQLITDDLKNPKITLYEHQNFQGINQSFTEESNLTYGYFSDVASSHIVQTGAWILYEHQCREGRRIVAHAGEKFGDYGTIGFHDQISHVRPLKAGRPTVKTKVLWDKMKTENEICSTADKITGVNRTDFEQEFSTTRSKQYASSVSYNFNFSNTTTIEVGTEFKFNLMPSVSTKVSNSLTVEKGKSETTTQTDSVELNMPAKIPPHTKLTFRVMRKECTIIVPVELTVEQNRKITTEHGELKCQMGSNIYAEYDSEKI